MITVYGEGRGLRVVWMLEEMGLPYRLVDIDLLSPEPLPADFLAINPAGYIPALRDGDVSLIESIAILEYLAARHGPTPLVPGPDSPDFATYKQFLMMGEAALANASVYYQNLRRLMPDTPEESPPLRFVRRQFVSRLDLVARQLEKTPFIAGDTFTAADISIVYGLNHWQINGGMPIEEPVLGYLARIRARPAYRRTLETCHMTGPYYASRGF